MRQGIIVGSVVLAVVAAVFVYTSDVLDSPSLLPTDTSTTTAPETAETTAVYRSAAYGFEFTYSDGPNGYIILEDEESEDVDFVTGLVLFNAKEYEEFQKSTDAREGPAAIQVRIYRNPANLHPPVWAMRHPIESNDALVIGGRDEAVVGGANAVHYLVDGLYLMDTYIVAHGEYIYLLTGDYFEEGDVLQTNFRRIVESFTFIQDQ